MYRIKFTHQFKKSLRLCIRRGLDPQKMEAVIDHLQQTGTLPPEYQPTGSPVGARIRWRRTLSQTG